MSPSRRQLLHTFALLLSATTLPGCVAAPATSRSTDVAAFLDAVTDGDLAAVERMLAARPELAAAVDARGRSAFVLAHLAGAPHVAERLAREGLELDLVESVLARDWERVEALAAAAPESVDAAHPIGGTALYAAARCGVPDLYRLRALGCAYDARPAGGSGWTPARAAAACVDPVGRRDAMQDLLGNGADPNAPQADRGSVLHGAVLARDTSLVRLVVRKGGDVGARNARGETPEELARSIGWPAGARLLAEHAAIARDCRSSRFAYDASRAAIVRPDLSDVPRPVQSAVTGASHARLPVVKEHLARDPRLVFSISTDEELAIEACAHTGMRPIVRLHLDHGAPYSLPTAVTAGDLEHARFLLDDDPARVHERGAHDFPVLWYAAIGGDQVELAELLLERGTPIEQECLGTTALHMCARRGRRELARFLLERGADPNAVGYRWDRAGETPLRAALAEGRDEVAAVLREAGGRI